MKKLGFVLIVILSFTCVALIYAQEKSKKETALINVDEMPEYPGGMEGLKAFIQEEINYPETAKKNGITGKVFVSFVVDKNGKVTNTKITKSVDPSLDKEAIRVIGQLHKWKPGVKDGKAVNVELTLPILFALDDSGKN